MPDPLDVAEPATDDECDREDCRKIATTASEVYCDITGGQLSYPTYDARTILAEASDYTQKLIDEEVAAVRRDTLDDAVTKLATALHDLRNRVDTATERDPDGYRAVSARSKAAGYREAFDALRVLRDGDE